MTDTTPTTTGGGANTRNTQYSGRGAENSGRGGRGGRGRSSNTGRGGGRSNGGGRGPGNQRNTAKKSSHSGQVQSGCMKGIVVSSDSNRATQYKALKDAIPIFCAEKGYYAVGEIVQDMEDWDMSNYYPAPPDDSVRKTFSTPYQAVIYNQAVKRIEKVQVQAQDSAGKPRTNSQGAPIMVVQQIQDRHDDGSLKFDSDLDPIMVDETVEVVRQVPVLGQKWVITDETEQKIVMGKYERAVRELEKKWHRCKDDKKLVMDMMWGQLDDDTQAQMELVPSYAKVRKDGDIVAFLKLLRDICNGSDDGGLSYHPFKVVAAIKALCNYTNSDVRNPHLYKKELKTKYHATKAICGDFPLGTKILLHVLQTPALGGNLRNTLSVYHGWTPDVQANWIRRYDDLALAMLFLNNSKNEDAKKELRRSFANGNKSAYQDTLEKMARLLSSQYPMTKGQNKKNTPNDGGKTKRKGGGNDANRDEENSGTPLAGAHTIDDDNAKKTTSSSTSANTAGAHISDSEECDPPTSSRSVQQLLASHPVDSPFWGDQDRTDDYSVDTDDSAQHLVGVHAYDAPPNDAERILAHAIHLCPQVCRYVWFNLRQLSTVTRQEGATLPPLSREENQQRVCTRNCHQMWQQMADAAYQQGIPFPPMRNGIPNFRAVARHGAHFPPMQYEESDFHRGQHPDE